jgi:hypothetical protein
LLTIKTNTIGKINVSKVNTINNIQSSEQSAVV